jgi:hypothetical protein
MHFGGAERDPYSPAYPTLPGLGDLIDAARTAFDAGSASGTLGRGRTLPDFVDFVRSSLWRPAGGAGADLPAQVVGVARLGTCRTPRAPLLFCKL